MAFFQSYLLLLSLCCHVKHKSRIRWSQLSKVLLMLALHVISNRAHAWSPFLKPRTALPSFGLNHL